MTLIINRLVRQNIFTSNFQKLEDDNELKFPESGIVVVYGPNGAGKTSLACVLAEEPNTEYSLTYNGQEYFTGSEYKLFHNISDQNGRNVIQGTTEDFILGDNIRREYELKKAIEKDFDYLYNSVLIPKLKSDFGITKKQSPFHEKITDKQIVHYVSDLANNRAKGQNIERSEFLNFIKSLEVKKIDEYDEAKFKFLIEDFSKSNSIIAKLLDFGQDNLIVDKGITKVEENTDAIGVLKKYFYINDCVVCDTGIDRLSLLEKKQQEMDRNYNELDDTAKKILEGLRETVAKEDPFCIKKALTESAISGSTRSISELLTEFGRYFNLFNEKLFNLFASSIEGLEILENQKEYESIIAEKPQLTDEDVLFIEKFVNDCIDKKIELHRDEEGNLELLLGSKKFLNEDRKNLSLSNGEQNFISIAFELLKAKKLEAPIVVLDDPISSFDSIYKNKIAYAIIKFLEGKMQIILTHNTDLIKLLEHQRSQCFNLYILNNTEGEKNGFIQIIDKEQGLLLYLHKLINFLRDDISDYIIDERLFLIALIPFMRSFSMILGKSKLAIKNQLTGVMHGYNDDKVNLNLVYNELFGANFFKESIIISVDDILKVEIKNFKILNDHFYPLLNRALVHVLTYLYLRLQVEKILVTKYQINTKKYDQLTRIINKAFNGSTQESVEKRVFLLSKKTLLNEFNHFDEDMNIFQPAMDITDTALYKEKREILDFLESL